VPKFIFSGWLKINLNFNKNMRLKPVILILLLAGVLLTLISIYGPFNKNSKDGSMLHLNDAILKENSGCYNCHGRMTGLSATHTAAGCIICHKGDGKVETKEKGHKGLIPVPGNFADMQETCGACHVESVHHITNSIMTTNSGIINVDRFIFRERDSPDGFEHIKDLGQSAADNHLRMLCAKCHLGKEKTKPRPVDQQSRGGGCLACHINYSHEALENHQSLKAGIAENPGSHPSIDLQISNDHCFGCHSRSGRISTNYEGWHETLINKDSIPEKGNYRVLEDGRVFIAKEEDIHHSIGLRCIDCHVYSGVMGDGNLYMHEEDAVRISCEDCHFESNPQTINYEDLSPIEKRIYAARGYTHDKMLSTKKGGEAILNTYLDSNGKAGLVGKFNQKYYVLKTPASSCTRQNAHQDLTCSSCHTAWAPQCAGCHVEYDKNTPGFDLFTDKHVQGTWIESAGGFFSGPPALGVYRWQDKKEITPAIPGMIMILDKSGYPGNTKDDSTFHRLYAPAKPHTISDKGRNCKSCHNDPVALGYGLGKLTFVKDTMKPHWVFEPEYQLSIHDNLPADAWIGFLQKRENTVSTRSNYSPFTIEEQKRILTAGACLTCHEESSVLMKHSLTTDFDDLILQMKKTCVKPVF
jgi:hypothetical protein